jgi:hypothetical protein
MARIRVINCKVDGCEKDAATNQTMCPMHRRRTRLYGDPHKTVRAPRGHLDAPPDPPDPAPAQVLREVLATKRGMQSFEWAWSVGLTHALQVAGPERSAWFQVFHQHRDEWRSAYLKLPTDRPFPVAAFLPVMDDRDPRPAHEPSGGSEGQHRPGRPHTRREAGG